MVRTFQTLVIIYCGIFRWSGFNLKSQLSFSEYRITPFSLQAMPIVVFVLFYSAVPVIDSAFIRIIFQRQLAVPPILLLEVNVKDRFAEGGYMHEKLTKTARGLRAYEQVRIKLYVVS